MEKMNWNGEKLEAGKPISRLLLQSKHEMMLACPRVMAVSKEKRGMYLRDTKVKSIGVVNRLDIVG